ncbi:intraflagellar transport 43 isoform X2 [Tachypleus tridentatus]|uniref:intraflagellar transport 43 isoform X2 n=1 Tax=Tachypleus tridentatus TaxID=6853 RepID=UPI003FCF6A33
MAANRKRKVDNENRQFHDDWTAQYCFVQQQKNVICLLCHSTVAVSKVSNIKCHYESKHKDFHNVVGDERTSRIESLRQSLNHQQNVFSKQSADLGAACEVSYDISLMIVKSSRPFTDGDFVKQCMITASEKLCPEAVRKLQMVALNRMTVRRRISHLSTDVTRQLTNKAANFVYCSLAADESTDISSTAELLVFVCGVSSSSSKEEKNEREKINPAEAMNDSDLGFDLESPVRKAVPRRGRRSQSPNLAGPDELTSLSSEFPLKDFDGPPQPPPRSRKTGGWADDSPSSTVRETTKSPKHETVLDKEDSDSELPTIPDLDEVREEDFTSEVAQAPSVAVNRVVTYQELDNDLLKHAAFTTLDGVGLHILTRCLAPENEIKEEDLPWTWNILFTDVASDLNAKWENSVDPDLDKFIS